MQYPSERLEALNRDYEQAGRIAKTNYMLAAILQVLATFLFISTAKIEELSRNLGFAEAISEGFLGSLGNWRAILPTLTMTVAFVLAARWIGANVGERIVAGKMINSFQAAARFLLPACLGIFVMSLTMLIMNLGSEEEQHFWRNFFTTCLPILPISLFTGFLAYFITQRTIRRRVLAD